MKMKLQHMSTTRHAHMPFDEFSSTQESPFTLSPVRKAELVWEMPAPSNPALRTMMDNAEKDAQTRRANPSISNTHWGFPPPAVPSHPTTSSTSTRSRTFESRSKSSASLSLETDEVLTQLTDFNYIMSVAQNANERAKERTKELGGLTVRKKVKVSHKVAKPEKLKGLRSVKGGKIQKIQKSVSKGKEKEVPNSRDESSAFKRPRFDDNLPMTNSSSASLTFDDSMVVDNSFSADAVMHSDTPHLIPQPLSCKDSPVNRDKPLPRSSMMATISTQSSMSSPGVNFHPLLLSTGKSLQPIKTRPSNPRLGGRSVEQSSNTQTVGVIVAPPSPSLPRPSARPPVLGMRRAATLPAKNDTGSSKGTRAGTTARCAKGLPTKQRPFKTPFLPSTQQSGDVHQCIDVAIAALPSAKRKIPSLVCSNDESDNEEAETSYEHDSFDLDALEETLKKYD
ncbi:hypothetical protein BDP27DRAFT_1424986 [Rhodocollybia butyracea]|uniref:Uncharacterized protein n=1 Tax=Rhodocollybia butyracea TaxID=206335 RepID=A0A9P5U453_9AGAR|nr:hypothetical protein BDP27DRAFT_1424986 [Rhodocollybia butyracea]